LSPDRAYSVAMNTQYLSMLAGVMSTSIFTLSHLPMLIRAYRTRDLRSYSLANLVLSNLGNVIHWLYIVHLPFGPIWFLHSFYTLVTGLMLFWYLRYRRPAGAQAPPPRGQRTAPAGRSRRVDQALRPSPPGQDP
jgi:uncharacterized protein with PQ loop repeat